MTIKIKKNCINCKNLTYEWGDVGDPEGYVCTRKDFQGKDEDEMIYNMNRQEYLEKAKVCFVSNKGAVNE